MRPSTSGGERARFARLVHADWSKHPRGRWRAEARRTVAGWHADGPVPVGDVEAFTRDLLAVASDHATLAGFDFPVGLPAGYGERTGLPGFRAALPAFGHGAWSRFFEVADEPGAVGLHRPFYPAGVAVSRRPLLDGHGVGSIDALVRACERGGPGRRAAGCMFWTLGGNQVGKAALHGWATVIRPGLAGGARLWPFDGALPKLAAAGGLTLCETYPADAYARVGAAFRPGESKRRHADRAAKAAGLRAGAERAGVALSDRLAKAIDAGFDPTRGRDDGFDAVVGLLGMIAVVDGAWPAGAPSDPAVTRWEGWILGRV